jgi:plasmid stabilization system protein ParE
LALEALAQNAEFIAADRPRKGLELIDAVEDLLKCIDASPLMGRKYEFSDGRLDGVRWTIVPGFPEMLLFYRPTESGIEFVHLLHGKRDLPEALFADFDL